jgi:phasin
MSEARSATRPGEKTAANISAANREFAQQGAAMAKDVADKTKAAADETNKATEQVYSVVTSGTAEFHRQWIEMARANTNATLDFAHQMIEAKSPSAFFELSAAHARKQVETFTEQAQHLAGLVQKITADAAAPLQASAKSMLSKVA